MRNYSTILNLFIILNHLQPAIAGNELENLKWLLGTWTEESSNAVTSESWHAVSDQTMEGQNLTFSKEKNQIVFKESLRIVSMDDGIYYLAKVPHNQLPVTFELTSCSDSLAVFENPDHDFPKRIEYRLLKKDILLVTVSNEGRIFKIEFKKEEDNL